MNQHPKTWLKLAQKLWPQHFSDMTEVTVTTGISKAVEVETQIKDSLHKSYRERKQNTLLEHYLKLKNKFDSKLKVFSPTKFDSELNSFITKVKK